MLQNIVKWALTNIVRCVARRFQCVSIICLLGKTKISQLQCRLLSWNSKDMLITSRSTKEEEEEKGQLTFVGEEKVLRLEVSVRDVPVV